MSLGALTTTFTPPVSCRASLVGPPIHDGTKYYQGPVFTSDCFPPNYSFSRNPENYYSPAIACPVGYSTGCTSKNVLGTVTETAVICCPPSLTCNPGKLQWEQTLGCHSRFRSTIFPTVNFMSGSVVTSTGATTETETFDGALNAYSVQIRFQSTDLPTTTTSESSMQTSTAASGTTPSGIITATSSSVTTSGEAPTASTEGDADGGGDGLSTGAAVGIGVGAALGALLLAGLALFLFIRRRNARRKGLDGHGPVELGGSGGDLTTYKGAIPPHAAGGSWKPKDHVGDGMVHEIHTETRVVELSADPTSTREGQWTKTVLPNDGIGRRNDW